MKVTMVRGLMEVVVEKGSAEYWDLKTDAFEEKPTTKFVKVFKDGQDKYEVHVDGIIVGMVWNNFGKFWVSEDMKGLRHMADTRKEATNQLLRYMGVRK